MEKYTIPRIVKERICVAPMTKEQFEKFKQKVTEYFGKDEPDLKHLVFDKDDFYRIFKGKYSKIGTLNRNYTGLEYSMIDCDEIKSSKTIEFSQIDFEEEEKQFDPNSLIGRKINGFKFEDDNQLAYWKVMDEYIGREGIINSYYQETNSFMVEFGIDVHWQYPAELIHLHLVEEETEVDKIIKSGGYPYVMKINEEEIPEPEELDLTKIITSGETYYSAAFGNVIYRGNVSGDRPIVIELKDNSTVFLYANGKIDNEGDLMIFPSKEIRTWENYSPFKKGEVCVFYRKNESEKMVGIFHSKEKQTYNSGYFKNEEYLIEDTFDFCERYDPSKFNF